MRTLKLNFSCCLPTQRLATLDPARLRTYTDTDMNATLSIGQVDFAETTETENGNGNTERKKVTLATVLHQELQLYFILFILG